MCEKQFFGNSLNNRFGEKKPQSLRLRIAATN